jgi:sulfoxide reductase heme-binding subunit YedZ
MVGLFAFFYGCLHLITYGWLYAWLEAAAVGNSFWAVVWADIAKRPYITMGFFGFLCMLPLAITSTAGWIRRMGGKKWQLLHRLIYFSAAAGVIHYYWLVKSDVRHPLTYGAIVGVLLLFRAGLAVWKRPKRTISKQPVSSPSSAF